MPCNFAKALKEFAFGAAVWCAFSAGLFIPFSSAGQRQGISPGFQAGEKDTGSGHVVSFPVTDPQIRRCIHECIRRNQMAAVGIEIIERKCRQNCELETALRFARSPEWHVYGNGIRMLCEINDGKAVGPLIQALKRDIRDRTGLWAWIIPALGRHGDPAAVPVLIESLNIMDVDWLGREEAARALGDIGDPKALPALIDAAERGDTRSIAIQTLAKFTDKRIIPVLLTALEPEEDAETRHAAISGIRNFGPMAVPDLIKAFAPSAYSKEHPETQKRLMLCRLLGESRDPRAVKMLRESLYDPDRAVSECASMFVYLHDAPRKRKFKDHPQP